MPRCSAASSSTVTSPMWLPTSGSKSVLMPTTVMICLTTPAAVGSTARKWSSSWRPAASRRAVVASVWARGVPCGMVTRATMVSVSRSGKSSKLRCPPRSSPTIQHQDGQGRGSNDNTPCHGTPQYGHVNGLDKPIQGAVNAITDPLRLPAPRPACPSGIPPPAGRGPDAAAESAMHSSSDPSRTATTATGMMATNLPRMPSMINSGTNAATVVDTAPMTGMATSPAPSMAAWNGGLPRRQWL